MSDDKKKPNFFNVNKLSTQYVKDGLTGDQLRATAIARLQAEGVKLERIPHSNGKFTEGAEALIASKIELVGSEFAFKTSLVDGSDAKGNANFTVSFMHVPSETQVYFKAFLTTFNETYKPEWTAETVYGRADPIYMFKNTMRSITVGLIIPAATTGEGFENLGKLQKLIQMQYPSYANVGGTSDNALSISQSPLIRLKVMNLATQAGVKGAAPDPDQITTKNYTDLFNTGMAADGLLGAVQNLTINYNVDNPEMGSFEVSQGTIVPKAIEINFDFNVIHEHALGWGTNGPINEFSQPNFPYNVNLEAAESTAADLAQKYARAEAAKLQAEAIANAADAAAILKAEQERKDNWKAKMWQGIAKTFAPKSAAARQEGWKHQQAMEQAAAARRRGAAAFAQSAALNESADTVGSTAEVDAAMADFID